MALRSHKTDEVVEQRIIYSTKDYSKFKILNGNRDINENHVKQLTKLMLTNGNLTFEYPIVVDEDGNVIDGQHRLKACEALGWEIGYTIEKGSTIETVRAINRGGHNWDWRDIAMSYAKLGNDNYQWFIEFVDRHNISFSAALRIADGKQTRRNMNGGFQGGGFEIIDRENAEELAVIVKGMQLAANLYHSEFTNAAITIANSPAYDDERMIAKLNAYGEMKLPTRGQRTEYMRTLEEIFNYGYSDENKARLF